MFVGVEKNRLGSHLDIFVKEGFFESVTSRQETEGSEKTSQVDIWKSIPGREKKRCKGKSIRLLGV